MGWEALRHWGPGAERLDRLAGGVANDVWRVRVGGEVAVGRLGKRDEAGWEPARS